MPHAWPVARESDVILLEDHEVSGADAERVILDYLRPQAGRLLSPWAVLNAVCQCRDRTELRMEKRFFLGQLRRLFKERKVKRYSTRDTARHKIRISEAHV